MQTINNGWEFTEQWTDAFCSGENSGSIRAVRIPHTVKELPLHYIDSSSYQMISGYRKKLMIPETLSGRRLFLQFDGAAHIATVYVNGKELTTHRNGYTGFRVEFTKEARFGGENLIAVRLDSTENPAIPPFGFMIDYLTYGGIYRSVYFEDRNSVYIKDAYVMTPSPKEARIVFQLDGIKSVKGTDSGSQNENVLSDKDMQGKASDGCSFLIKAELLDKNGSCLTDASLIPDEQSGKGELRLSSDQILPWSPEDPVLYTMKLSLYQNEELLDTLEKTVGFRTISLTENEILINGKPVFLHGLNRHQCWPYVGYAVPEKLQREDARILQEELRLNAVRTSHYPQSHDFLDECDRRGILVFTEIPGWQHIGDSEEWKEQCIKNVEEMVIQYRHHPSVIMWGVRINESQDDDELYKMTNAKAHRLDPMRPTSGVRYLEKSSLLEDIYSYNDFSHTGKNPGAKQKKDVTPDMKKPLLISESNGHMFPTKSFDTWERRQEHALRHARVLDAAMADGEHAGCFEWCMFDYPTHKDFGSGDRTCYHGVTDMFRNPKTAAAAHASQSDGAPVLEISSSMDIGDYPGGQIGDVYAFTNADEIHLYKNDRFVSAFGPDKKTWAGLSHPPILIDDFIGNLLKTEEHMPDSEAALIRDCLGAAGKYGMANLPVSYQAKLGFAMLRYRLSFSDGYRLYGKYVGNWGGEATRWRFDAIKNGKTIASVTKMPSAKLHLHAEASHTALAEGETYDMAAVRIRILDENNNTASYAQLPVSFSVSGALELVGSKLAAAEGGMTGTYVRTTGETGEGTLTISAEGLESVLIHFTISSKED